MVVWPYSYSTTQTGTVEFTIGKGQTLGATAKLLADRGLIMSRYLFVGYALFSGNEKTFKAGRYAIPERTSIKDLVDMFSGGLSESEDTEVTIPEGSNIADIAKILAKAGLIKEKDLLKPETLGLEGYLFPDTYRFEPDQILSGGTELKNSVNAEEIIQKMRDNFNKKTDDLFTGRFTGKDDSGGERQAVIIASILEKEVKTEKDMKLVAGIIEKRLELGMPLELDATVTYGVCLEKFIAGQYCDVSLANIVDNIPVDSAYNTYKRRGLPIGPISNPGLAALRAALNPQPNDYLYYLSAKDGTTIFSKTAAEHQRARQKYLNK